MADFVTPRSTHTCKSATGARREVSRGATRYSGTIRSSVSSLGRAGRTPDLGVAHAMLPDIGRKGPNTDSLLNVAWKDTDSDQADEKNPDGPRRNALKSAMTGREEGECCFHRSHAGSRRGFAVRSLASTPLAYPPHRAKHTAPYRARARNQSFFSFSIWGRGSATRGGGGFYDKRRKKSKKKKKPRHGS